MSKPEPRHDMPWEHAFEPDPLTPTACVICALHPAWHPEHQPKDSDRYISLPQQAAFREVRERKP